MGRVDGTPVGGERVLLHRLARALGPVALDPDRDADRLSASYLIALAARIVDEVGDLLRRSRAADKHLATLSLDTEIRFRDGGRSRRLQ